MIPDYYKIYAEYLLCNIPLWFGTNGSSFVLKALVIIDLFPKQNSHGQTAMFNFKDATRQEFKELGISVLSSEN